MALKALLFDCDGVIAETESDCHRVAFNITFERENIDAYWDVDEYGELVEIGGGKERMSAFFAKDPVKYPPDRFTPEYIASLHKIKTELFMQLCVTLPPRPGVRRLMLEAADAGVRVFICSTSNEKSVACIARSLLGDDMERVITHIYAGDMVKAKKPAPDIYLKVPEDYEDITAEDCVVIEDTRIGLLAAKAAGMRCLVTMSMYSRGDDFSEADVVVDCLGEEDIPCNPSRGALPADTGYITLDLLKNI